MAGPSQATRVRQWENRITTANKLYDKWAEKYETERLEKYYLGEQHRGVAEDAAKKMYVINMVFASIEVNKPALIFTRPQAQVQARPSRQEDLGATTDERAHLCRDAIQTFIDDPDIGFEEETALALHEAHFRYGVIEVGYSADWVENPDAGKPVLKDGSNDPLLDSDGDTVKQGARTIKKETLYVKRIPADTFRVSVSSKNKLRRNDWVGYYEWVYTEDLKRSKDYTTAGLKSSGTINKELRDTSTVNADDLDRHHGMTKVWKVWDLRRKVHHVIAEGFDKFLIEDEPWKFLPLSVVKFHEILNSFYPLPPVYSWLGPQDEINETREMQRAHRRRFYRRYTVKTGSMDAKELEKLETGGDGVYAEANISDPITAVPDAPLSADNWTHLDQSKQDFMVVSAVGGEQRGVADSETATQASIIDQRSRLRESSARTRVSNWLAEVSRLILLTIHEKMALPFLIKRTTDPKASPEQAAKDAGLWKQIMAEDLGDMDLDVSIDIASMSPVTEEVQRNAWNMVLTVISNPAIRAILGQSPVLLRKTLTLYGMTSETEIAEVFKILQAISQQEQQAMSMAAITGGKAPAGVAPAAAPTAAGGSQITGDKLAAVLGAASQQ